MRLREKILYLIDNTGTYPERAYNISLMHICYNSSALLDAFSKIVSNIVFYMNSKFSKYKI